MSNENENHVSSLFDALSSSTREVMNGYARFLAPEWLNQPILQGWRIGNTYIVSDDNSRDPGMERRIVAQNSYGRQLGRIMDAMEVLIELVPPETRTTNSSLRAFRELAQEIKEIKEKAQTNRYDKLKAGLELLRNECPEDFERLMKGFRAL
ncbi:hypothetical protein [Cupriavidus sp. AcVe19-6a]|uniref:hypothetical protein n=1 Tax=Cupriavidus sp. AcVe19-6a TaxID=2821358 RepID=UPI001AE2D386|nr:hypothetical protein [Cupriavidus sp. AcVe19-6a]MBP0639105.1 hypothetical protein [Cupriavidus sp. AcVe19-6a]